MNCRYSSAKPVHSKLVPACSGQRARSRCQLQANPRGASQTSCSANNAGNTTAVGFESNASALAASASASQRAGPASEYFSAAQSAAAIHAPHNTSLRPDNQVTDSTCTGCTANSSALAAASSKCNQANVSQTESVNHSCCWMRKPGADRPNSA